MSGIVKKQKTLKAFLIFIIGCVFVIGLFLWYKTFAYYTHSIYTYEVVDYAVEPDTGIRQMTVERSRLKRFYETTIYNYSPQEITAEIYEGEVVNKAAVIASGEWYRFDSYHYSYTVVITGEDITEENVVVKASTLSYLKQYRRSVIITMVAGLALTGIWTLLVLVVPDQSTIWGTRINIVLAIVTSLGSISLCIMLYRGYYESNLCFLSFLCSAFAFLMKKREPYKIWKEKMSYCVTDASLSDGAYLAAGTAAMFFSCMLFGMMLNSKEGSPLYIFNSRNKMSLPDYMITVIVFLALFLLFCCILIKNKELIFRLKYYCEGRDVALCVCFSVAALFVQQDTLQMAGNPVNAFISLAVFCFLFLLLKRTAKINKGSGFASVVYMAVIAIVALSTTVINSYYMGWNTVNHVGWYYRQMYYVVNGLSFSHDGMDLYGHYPYFYKLPMELFGANLLTVGVVTGIVGGMTALFAVMTIHMLTRSAVIRMIGAIAVGNMLASSLYLAIVPHRLLFPAMLMFFITICSKKNIKYYIPTGFLISILACVWNTETGAVVFITWIAYLMLRKIEKKDGCLRDFLFMTLKVILLIIFGGCLLFGGYKICSYVAHGFDINYLRIQPDDMGVLLNPDYMLTEQFNFIRWTNSPWIYIMMFFLGTLGYGMTRMNFFDKVEGRNKRFAEIIISISIMGLGLMVYFISRPEDYNIIILFAICLMVVIMDKFHRSFSSQNNSYMFFAYIICLMGISCMLTRLGDMADSLQSRIFELHQLDYAILEEDLERFSEEVPENTFVDGVYIPGGLVVSNGLIEIYMCLDRTIPLESEKAAMEYFITTSPDIDDLSYTLFKEIPFGEMKYYLYQNTNYK